MYRLSLYQYFTLVVKTKYDASQLKVKNSYDKISIRRNIRTANLFYGEISVRRNIRMAKFPAAKFPYGEISLRRNFFTSKFPTAKFLMAKFPTANLPSARWNICRYRTVTVLLLWGIQYILKLILHCIFYICRKFISGKNQSVSFKQHRGRQLFHMHRIYSIEL